MKEDNKGECEKDFEENEIEMEILREIGSIGAGHAATALSDLLGQKISITFPEIYIIQPEDVPEALGLHEMPSVVIYKTLQKNHDCGLLLAFDRKEADKMLSIMAKHAFGLEELDEEMKESAIDELGNIVLGAFISAISDFVELELLSTPPFHVVDIFDAVLDIFLANLCLQSKEAVVFKTCFKKEEEKIYGAIVVFFDEKMREDLVRRGKRLVGIA